MNNNYCLQLLFVFAVGVAANVEISPATAAFRDVQFKTIDFETSVLELHNFGDTAEPFINWRFCSHDDDQQRRYSTPGALDSITLDAGESIFFHFNNDAPGGATDAFNISGLGNFAGPLDQDAYAINLYVNSSFSVPAAMVDHVQWSIDGANDETADARSVTAQNANLWTDEEEWVSTSATSIRLELDVDGLGDPPAGTHGPTSYLVIEPPLPLPADLDDDDDVDGADLALWAASYATDENGDVNGNGITDGDDFIIWQQQFSGPAGVATVAVPEPTGLMLATVGAVLVCGRRRRG